ncbi:MAG: hypothetical protein KJZ47_13530 [Gemmatimonadales bacterium]|nr:hypothetical protein [Gemmatimonadales bacterium]
MPRPPLRFATLPGLALLAACGSTVHLTRPIPESQHGTFRFTDRVSAASPTIVVEGEFTIRADTILAQVTSGNCRPTIPPSTQSFRFDCGQVSLAFDRYSPLQRGSYSVQGTAMEMRRVCVRFVPNSSGQQVCVQYGQESVQVVRNFGGRIRPIPVP